MRIKCKNCGTEIEIKGKSAQCYNCGMEVIAKSKFKPAEKKAVPPIKFSKETKKRLNGKFIYRKGNSYEVKANDGDDKDLPM